MNRTATSCSWLSAANRVRPERKRRRPILQTRKPSLHKVCRLHDIVPGTGVCALVGGDQIAIFRLGDDSVRAVGNHDPMSGANVLSRGIVGDLKGELVVA